jgi:phosphopantetheinyl transferase (holo-ACP synthase)
VRELILDANRGRFFPGGSVDAWMAANPEAVTRMGATATETLLTRRIQTGKITEGDARFIAGSPWGKEAISKAIQNRTDIQNEVNKLSKELGFNSSEWLGEQIRKNPVFWLSIIFGTAALGAIAAPMIPAIAGLGIGMGSGAVGGGAAGLSGLIAGRAEYSR